MSSPEMAIGAVSDSDAAQRTGVLDDKRPLRAVFWLEW